MRDLDIRRALWVTALAQHAHEPDTLIMDELGLNHGNVRVDVAVVNGLLTGYEIKSDADTLQRLPVQAGIYSAVLDRVFLVCGNRHALRAEKIVPEWWGMLRAEAGADGVKLVEVRPPQSNPAVDPIALASLLWRDEALRLLGEINADHGVRSAPRRTVYRRLAERLELPQLAERVRSRLKLRARWRADALRT